ncbi:hypothetical protein DFJ58DRAFT_734774 [Suillus subalutaceus]|uniref:uncharacterized protein n=1 Tax=Suillus subalutaceus TaxID=48586 RepID=UPI001B8816F3|nr:uncharacterized protein DFJ58DRAFT_734774 [Suillus subalutaceus]KAG1836771.1 hypothetical protein DFJ58DRAFT_734774 [Suillus subalutaceus]
MPALSVEIRVSYQDELLNQGDESFGLSFPPVRGVHPYLMLKAAIVHACDDHDGALFVIAKLLETRILGHAQFAVYVMSKMVSHLDNAVQHFQLLLD